MKKTQMERFEMEGRLICGAGYVTFCFSKNKVFRGDAYLIFIHSTSLFAHTKMSTKKQRCFEVVGYLIFINSLLLIARGWTITTSKLSRKTENMFFTYVLVCVCVCGCSYTIQRCTRNATHCVTLQHTATHCNTLQRTASLFHIITYQATCLHC